MTTVAIPELGSLTDEEIAQLWHDRGGELDLGAIEAEFARREQAEQRRGRARAAARVRHQEWETAAYAQYQAASAYCNGDHNMLSAAGERAKREAWPMLWQGSDETAWDLASEEMQRFWTHESTRMPGPRQYAAAKRAAAAEHAARSEPQPTAAPRMAPVPSYRRPTVPVPDYSPRPATTVVPGSMARYITALGAIERQANRTARALSRVNGGIQR